MSGLNSPPGNDIRRYTQNGFDFLRQVYKFEPNSRGDFNQYIHIAVFPVIPPGIGPKKGQPSQAKSFYQLGLTLLEYLRISSLVFIWDCLRFLDLVFGFNQLNYIDYPSRH